MKKLLLSALAAGTVGLTACDPNQVTPEPDGGTPDGGPTQAEVVPVFQSIKGDTTWTSDKVYDLRGDVFVESGVLTIQPGTKVTSTGGALVITSNARIQAEGTAEAPIVFTSGLPEGSRAAGNWKGLVLLGNAPHNVLDPSGAVTRQTIEGFAANASDQRPTYGGTDAAHNCGTLKYVRIEFTGFEVAPGNELQGLTVGGCGTGTTIDFLQSHRSLDDGIEVFGGTLNMKHVVITGAEDDGLDWDQGWAGKVQFLVVNQNVAGANNLGNNGFEGDNQGTNNNAQPRSKPVIYNATVIGRPSGGADKNRAMELKRGTAGLIANSVFAYLGNAALDVVDNNTGIQWKGGSYTAGGETVSVPAGELAIRNSIFWSVGGAEATTIPYVENKNSSGAVTCGSACFDESVELLASGTNNRAVDPGVPSPRTTQNYVTAPSYAPAAGSAALTSARLALPANDPFFETADFIGAVGTNDWTAGWTSNAQE